MTSSSDEDIRKKGDWLLVNHRGSVENSDEESPGSGPPSPAESARPVDGAVATSVPDEDAPPQLDSLQVDPVDSPSLVSSTASWSSGGSTLVGGLPSPQRNPPPEGRLEDDPSCVSEILRERIEKEDSHSLDSFEVLSEGPSLEGGMSVDDQEEDCMSDEEEDDNDPQFPVAQGFPPRPVSDSDSDFVRLPEPTESAPSGVEELGAEAQSPLSYDRDSSSPESHHGDPHSSPYGGSSASGEESEASPALPPRPQNAPYQDVRGCPPSEEESDLVRIMSRRWPTEDGGFLLVQRFRKLDPDSLSMMSSSMSDVSGFSMLGGSSHHGMLSDTHEEEEGSDTESEASDSSFASEETLPVNMTMRNLPPALRQYLHHRNDVINSKLSLLAILVLTAGLILGIGHFVGSSQMVSHHKSLQEGQKLRLRSLQDELVSCMERRKTTSRQLQERNLEYQECNREREAALKQTLAGSEDSSKGGPLVECMDSVDARVCNQCRKSGLRYTRFCNTLCPVATDEHGHSWANAGDSGIAPAELGPVVMEDVAGVERVAPELGGAVPRQSSTSPDETEDGRGVASILDDGIVAFGEYADVPDQLQMKETSMLASEEATPAEVVRGLARPIPKVLEGEAVTPEEDMDQGILGATPEETLTPAAREDSEGIITEYIRLDTSIGINPLMSHQAADEWVCARHDRDSSGCVEWAPFQGQVTVQQRGLDGKHTSSGADTSTSTAHPTETDKAESIASALQHPEGSMKETNPGIPSQTLDDEKQGNIEQAPQNEEDDQGTNLGGALETQELPGETAPDVPENEVKWVCVDGASEDCLEWVPKSLVGVKSSHSTPKSSKEGSVTGSGAKKIHPDGVIPLSDSDDGGEKVITNEKDETASVEGALLSAWSVFKDMSQKVFTENVSSSIESAFQSVMGIVSNASQHLMHKGVSATNVTDVMVDVKKHVNDLKEVLESSLASVQSAAAQGFREHVQPALEEVTKMMDSRNRGGHRKGKGHGKGHRATQKNGKPKQMALKKGGGSNQHLGSKKSSREGLFPKKNSRNHRVLRKSGKSHFPKKKIIGGEPVSNRRSRSNRAQDAKTSRNKKGGKQMSGRKSGKTNQKHGSTKEGKFPNRRSFKYTLKKTGMDLLMMSKNAKAMMSLEKTSKDMGHVGETSKEVESETVDGLNKIKNDGEKDAPTDVQKDVENDTSIKAKSGAENSTNIPVRKEPTVDRLGGSSNSEKNGTGADPEKKTTKKDKKKLRKNTNPPRLNIEKVLSSLDMSCRGEARCVENHKVDAARLLREMIGYRQWLWEQRFRKDVDEVEDFMEELEEFIDEDEVDDEDIEDLRDEFEDMMEDIQKTTKKFFQKQQQSKKEEESGRGGRKDSEESKKGKNDVGTGVKGSKQSKEEDGNSREEGLRPSKKKNGGESEDKVPKQSKKKDGGSWGEKQKRSKKKNGGNEKNDLKHSMKKNGGDSRDEKSTRLEKRNVGSEGREPKKGMDIDRDKQLGDSQPKWNRKQTGSEAKPKPGVGDSKLGAAEMGKDTGPGNVKKEQQRNLGERIDDDDPVGHAGGKQTRDVGKDSDEEVHTVVLNVQDLPGMRSSNSSVTPESNGGRELDGESKEATGPTVGNAREFGERPKEQSGTSYANTDQWFFRRAHDRDLRRGRDPDGAGWYFKRFKVWDEERKLWGRQDWYFERGESRREGERGCATQPAQCAWARDESVVTVWEMYKWLTERFSIREDLRVWDLEDQINWFLRKP